MTQRGLVDSRSRAQSLIMAAKVRLNGAVITKAGTQVGDDAEIELITPDHPYVSRGALKLEAMVDAMSLDVKGFDCLDVGASTGGFTDLLLQRGARRVIALDVGRGQLAWRLRSDERVVVMEGVNARHLRPGDLPFAVDLATFDVAYISLGLVVPPVLPFITPGGLLICLVKPQFEGGRSEVGKGGIVRDEGARRDIIDRVVTRLEECGLSVVTRVVSPIRGQKGNLEELVAFRISSERSTL